MAEYIIDRVGESSHIGNNEAGKDININTFNIQIQLPTFRRLHDFNERLEDYSQCPFLRADETNAPLQDQDLRDKIQKFKLLISACRQRDDVNQDSRHALSGIHEKLDGLWKRFGEPITSSLSGHSPGQMSPLQVTSAPATPIPTTPGSETPAPAALNPTTLYPSTKSQTSDHRTSVESCFPNSSKGNRLSAQSLEKVLSGMLAEFYAAESTEPLKDALSSFTFSRNGIDSSMEAMTSAPTFSMQSIFRYTLGQQMQTLYLDRTFAHLKSDPPIQMLIVGEKAKDAVSEWLKTTFGERKQKWDSDYYTDIRVTSPYCKSIWDTTFRLHVPKRLKGSKELENLKLDLVVFFFDKADAKTLETIAQHFKTEIPTLCILLGLDKANELTKSRAHPPDGAKFVVEPVSKAGIEKALEHSGAVLYIECARSQRVALMKLFSVLFCVALSARQKSGRRSSST